MNIVGKKVFLRALEPDDMEVLRTMTNDPEMESKIGGWSYPISKDKQMKWYDGIKDNSDGIRLAIVDIETNEFLGMLNLVNIDWKNGTAFHGIRLSNNTPKGKGIGTDSVMCIMRYAFEELRLNRLEGGWLTSNLASQNLYKKCGWVAEGIKRKSIFCNGTYVDFEISGILAEEYFEIKKALVY